MSELLFHSIDVLLWAMILLNEVRLEKKWQKISRYSRINLKKYLRLLLDDDIHNSVFWSSCHQNTEKIATAMVGLKWMLRWMITRMQTNSFSSQKKLSLLRCNLSFAQNEDYSQNFHVLWNKHHPIMLCTICLQKINFLRCNTLFAKIGNTLAAWMVKEAEYWITFL